MYSQHCSDDETIRVSGSWAGGASLSTVMILFWFMDMMTFCVSIE